MTGHLGQPTLRNLERLRVSCAREEGAGEVLSRFGFHLDIFELGSDAAVLFRRLNKLCNVAGAAARTAVDHR